MDILSQEENLAKQAVDAHAELNLAGIPSMNEKRQKLSLVERIRLIPGMVIDDSKSNP